LATYIPEFRNSKVAVSKRKKGYRVVKAKRPIRIRDLLTHTAGVGYGFGPAASQWKKADLQGWYFAHKNESILESVREMAKLPMDAHPGEAFVYGYSTDILGAVIEEISGKSLDVFLKERIFDRLGMVDTHFYLPAEKTSRLSVVYNQEDNKIVRADDDGEEESQGHYVVGPRKSFSGGAGLLSTSDDYARFLQMLLNGGIYNDSRILSRKSVELMIADQMNGDHYNGVRFPWDWGTGFGLGFSITNHLGDRGVLGSVGEFGWGGAYHSNYFVNPEEKLLAVYFTQVVPITLDDHQKLKSLVYQAIVD
jgi:CubicO group peptidase (beta-lactamase class C family)